MRKIGMLLLAGVLAVVIWGGLFSHPAASQQIESRLSNLEADFNRLESQINQLQSQLQGRPQSSPRTTLAPPQSQRSRRNLPQENREKMFDRLATLVVELKQQVNALEKRVNQLEKR